MVVKCEWGDNHSLYFGDENVINVSNEYDISTALMDDCVD